MLGHIYCYKQQFFLSMEIISRIPVPWTRTGFQVMQIGWIFFTFLWSREILVVVVCFGSIPSATCACHVNYLSLMCFEVHCSNLTTFTSNVCTHAKGNLTCKRYVCWKDLRKAFFLEIMILTIWVFLLLATSSVSQPNDDGLDYTVMDWISAANKRKYYLIPIA